MTDETRKALADLLQTAWNGGRRLAISEAKTIVLADKDYERLMDAVREAAKVSTLEWAIGCKDKQILEFADALRAPSPSPGREAIARTLADKLWCGATFDDGTESERDAFLNAADAVLALSATSPEPVEATDRYLIAKEVSALENQLYEMRSLKGWRMNLVRTSIQKIKAIINSPTAPPPSPEPGREALEPFRLIALDVLGRTLADDKEIILTIDGKPRAALYARDFRRAAAALIATVPPSPEPGAWRERWYGSAPWRGWSIVTNGGDLVAYIGGDESMSKAITAIVMAHNAAAPPPSPAVEREALEKLRTSNFANYLRIIARESKSVFDKQTIGEVADLIDAALSGETRGSKSDGGNDGH